MWVLVKLLTLVLICISTSSTSTSKFDSGTSEPFPQAISNLQHLLQPYQNQHCLILLTSPGTADILNLSSPVVLRKLETVLANQPETHPDTSSLLIWNPENNVNLSVTTECTFTEYHYRSPYFRRSEDYCTEIYLQQFIPATKPWNCDLLVDIFVPINLLNVITGPWGPGVVYPHPFKYTTRAPLVARTYIQVANTKAMDRHDYQSFCQNLTQNHVNFHAAQELTSEYFTAYVEAPSQLDDSMTVTFVQSYHNCQIISSLPINLWRYRKLSSSSNRPEQTRFWYIPWNYFVPNSDLFKSLLQCDTSNIFTRYLKQSLRSGVGRFTPKAQAYIIQTILGNFTYKINNFSVCTSSNGALSIQKHDQLFNARNFFIEAVVSSKVKPLDAQIYLTDYSEVLRFVTIHPQGSSALPFHELLNVFHPTVWILSIVTFTLVCVVIKMLLGMKKSGGISKQLLALVMCLLEQGDPYPPKICQIDKIKLLLAGIFGLSIILSNGYRSDNIDQMVKSRQLTFFQTLEELINANYLVYTRLDRIRHDLETLNGTNFFQRPNGSIIPHMTRTYNTFRTLADCSSVIAWPEIGSKHYFLKSAMSNESEPLTNLEILMKHVTLPKKLLEFIRSNFHNRTQFPQKIYSDDFKVVQSSLNEFIEYKANRILIEELMSTEQVAIIVPISAALQIRNLLKARAIQLYMGTESYTGRIKALYIQGSIDFKLLRRIWAVKESGINVWWYQLLDPTRYIQPDLIENVMSTRITGNILIVFVVWLCGIGVSIVSMLGELCVLGVKFSVRKVRHCCSRTMLFCASFVNAVYKCRLLATMMVNEISSNQVDELKQGVSEN